MHSAACVLGTACTILACAAAAAAPCAVAQRDDLVRLGYGTPEVIKMCGSAAALFEMGSKVRQAGDLKTAQSLFEMGLSLDPNSVLGRKLVTEIKEAQATAQQIFAQAYSAKEAGDLQASESLFEQGLVLDPGNTLGQNFLHEVRESRGNARKLFAQGFEAKQAGDLRTAERMFDMGLKIEPGNAVAQKLLLETRAQLAMPAVPADPAAAIQQVLETTYRPSKANAEETDIEALGATVSLQKSTLVMSPVFIKNKKNNLKAANMYEDGAIKAQGLGSTLTAINTFLGKLSNSETSKGRFFNPGDTFLVTRIAVRDGEIVFNLMSSVINNERFSGILKFKFTSRDANASDQATALVAQVLRAQ